MDSRLFIVALNMIDGIGSVKTNRLIGRFGSAENVFKAGEGELAAVEGIGPALAGQIKKFDLRRAEAEIKEAADKGIDILTVHDENYPDLLKKIYDPPPVLYAAGDIPQRGMNIGFVGTRNATDYGAAATKKLIKGLHDSRAGVNIISGMARGIDTVAHLEAAALGMPTVAVLGFGLLNKIYPFERHFTAKAIMKTGALVSEFPLRMIGLKQNFPRRNRVISGMSHGTVIVEAAARSGALITADCALEQNREVFAVPASIFAKSSEGVNRLLSQGAKPVTCGNDILEEFGIAPGQQQELPEITAPNLSEQEKKIIEIIGSGKKHVDNIMIESNMDINVLSTILLSLELKGAVKKESGMNYSKREF